MITQLIHRIRNVIYDNRRRYEGYLKCQTVSDKTVSRLKTNMYTCSIWIRKAIKSIQEILRLMATLQTNIPILITDNETQATSLQNARFLYDSEIVSEIVDGMEFPHLMKRNSDFSTDLQEQSLMTSKTCYTALGLHTASAMKDHFNKFVLQNGTNSFDPITDFQAHLDGFATTAAVYMPAFMPSCSVLYEEGCRFIDGHVRSKIICCQISGVIRYVKLLK